MASAHAVGVPCHVDLSAAAQPSPCQPDLAGGFGSQFAASTGGVELSSGVILYPVFPHSGGQAPIWHSNADSTPGLLIDTGAVTPVIGLAFGRQQVAAIRKRGFEFQLHNLLDPVHKSRRKEVPHALQ